MKKKIKLFLLLIVVFSYSSVVNASTYYVTGDGVRIRSSAENTADNVIGKLNYGDKIEVIDLENSWYKILLIDMLVILRILMFLIQSLY